MTENKIQIDIDQEQQLSGEKKVRLEKLQTFRDQGIEPFKYAFNKTHDFQKISDDYQRLETGEKSQDIVHVAGRLVAKRGHGKATFGNLQDETGTLQYYAALDQLGEKEYQLLLSLDVGDIIGVEGSPFKSKRGELTLRILNFVLLTKSLNPLPEKFHGLQDKETRYRQRYVDLIANPEVRKTFKTRSKVIHFVRNFLDEENFLEVETPVLQSIYGGASAKPFSTHHNDLDQNLFLRISLELPLKRIIVGGFERIFEIGRVFRNEGVSFKHNPEYTLLELYQAYADYTDIMKLTEELISGLVKKCTGSTTLTYQGQELDFSLPFKRLTMDDALQQYASISIHADVESLVKKAKELGLDVPEKAHRGELINLIYDKAVEKNLIQPTFIMDYPWETSPLAKRKRDDKSLVERFELIVNTMELANAFSELNDPIEQKARFDDQKKAKEAGFEETHETDDDFVEALKYGMPPTGGLGIGIDRLVMLVSDMPSIRDVLFFPHMKDKGLNL